MKTLIKNSYVAHNVWFYIQTLCYYYKRVISKHKTTDVYYIR